MTKISEAQLITAARRGDPAAMGDLLERHQHRLYNTSLRMLGNRDDAAEITQEAMLKIIEHLGQYNGQSAILTWMIRIVMNLSISHLRKMKRRRTISLEGSDANGSGGLARGDGEDLVASLRQRIADEREPPAPVRVEQNERLELAEEALERLDEDFRAVLILRDINDMDYRQIAESLSVPIGTVKSRLFRARLALRKQTLSLLPSHRPNSPLTEPRRADL